MLPLKCLCQSCSSWFWFVQVLACTQSFHMLFQTFSPLYPLAATPLQVPTSLPGPRPLGDGALAFDGRAALTLSVAPASVGSDWSATFWLRQDSGSTGYIFAKTDASGSRR